MRNKPKLAIVGIGRWGKNLLAEFDRQTEVVTVCHKESEETKKWLEIKYPHIKSVSLDKILKEEKIVAVAVATPVQTHLEIGKKILESNKHLFIEKPAGLNKSETIQLLNLAKKQNKVMMVDYVYLYHPVWEKIKEELKTRSEKPLSLITSWLKWGTFETSIIENLFCHEVALAKNLFAESVIEARKLMSFGLISSSDIVLLELLGNKKNIGFSFINRLSENKNKIITVKGTNGSNFIWDNNKLYEILNNEKIELPIKKITALENECSVFIKAIKDENIISTDGEFAVKVQQIMGNLTI